MFDPLFFFFSELSLDKTRCLTPFLPPLHPKPFFHHLVDPFGGVMSGLSPPYHPFLGPLEVKRRLLEVF